MEGDMEGDIIRSGGIVYKSGCWCVCPMIVLIILMAANVVIIAAGTMPGDDWQLGRSAKWKRKADTVCRFSHVSA